MQKVEEEIDTSYLPINPDTQWAKLTLWRKRWDGFRVYLMFAFFSLWEPETADAVMFRILKRQFIDINPTQDTGTPP